MAFLVVVIASLLTKSGAAAGKVASLRHEGHQSHPFAPEAYMGEIVNRHDVMKKSTGTTVVTSLKEHFDIAAGSLGGALVGSMFGALIGYYIDSPGKGAVIGAVSAGLIGGCFGHCWPGLWPEPEHVKKPTIATKEFPEPASEKLKQQAAMAVTLSDYEQKRAETKGNNGGAETAKEAERKAQTVLEKLSKTIDESRDEGKNTDMKENADEFEDIQDVLSQVDATEMVTAESAKANNAIVTASDLASVHGVRGEDLGPAGDKVSYQGDMVPGDDKQMALFQTLSAGSHLGNQTPGIAAGRAWTGGKVKYCFASDVPSSVRHIFMAAVNQYSRAVPCLSFEDVGWKSGKSTSPESGQRCNEAPAIFVQSNPRQGCYSYVGMLDATWHPTQRLQLQDPGCVSVGTAIHELGHALGMAHEQSRPDRDKYVQIHWDNIEKGMEHNFDKVPGAYTSEAYDLLSVMHYDAFAFAKDRKKTTIEYIGEGVHEELGQRVALSKYDVSQVAAMYADKDRDCKGTALAGMGCINKPDSMGRDVCNIEQCNSQAASLCCGCGGGVFVQCYQGQPCPKSDPLPDMDASECVQDATHLFPASGVPCIYQNVCSFDVGFTCSGGCNNEARSKAFAATQCNGRYVTDICKAAHNCKIIKK